MLEKCKETKSSTCILGVKFDYELSLRKLKNYPKDLLKTMLINFTRTGHELVSKFTINIGFTKT